MEDGPPMFRQSFSCSVLLDFTFASPFVYGAVTVYGRTFQNIPLELAKLKGCSPFARRYWGNLG